MALTHIKNNNIQEIMDKTSKFRKDTSLILSFYYQIEDIDKDIDKSQLIRKLIDAFEDITSLNKFEIENRIDPVPNTDTGFCTEPKRYLDLPNMVITRRFASDQFDAVIARVPVYSTIINNEGLESYNDEVTIYLKLDKETSKFDLEKIEFLSETCINAVTDIDIENQPVFIQEKDQPETDSMVILA